MPHPPSASDDLTDACRAFLAQSLAGFYIVQDGRTVFANPRAAAIFGYTVEEFLALPPIELVVPEEREDIRRHVANRLSGTVPSAHYSTVGLRRDGREVHIEVHGSSTTYRGRPAIAGMVLDVSEAHRHRQRAAEKERRLHEITSLLTEGVYVVDAEGCIEFMNPAAEAMLGWRQEELLGKDAHRAFHHMRPDSTPCPIDECSVARAQASSGVSASHEDCFVRRDGGLLPVAISASPILRDGAPCGAVVAFHDIAERLQQQEVLRESEERYRLLFNYSLDAIFVHHLDEHDNLTTFVEVNDVACERLGYTREELLTLGPADIDAPDSGVCVPSIIERARRHGFATFEQIHLTRDGRRIPVEISTRLFEHDGRPTMLSLVRDITERKRSQERIQHLAHHDALTDLPNRRLLTDRLDQALALGSRHWRPIAVLMLDLDGFKPVNDTYGHDVGDELLVELARRLKAVVRRSDTIARLGGDEFVILLSELQRSGDAELVASKIIAAMSEPVAVRGVEVRVSASVGIAVFPDNGQNAAALLKAADRAMYRAKAEGRNRYTLCPPDALSAAG